MESRNIVIIGGGPAGLQAAASISSFGYNAILIEKEPLLGGHLRRWDRLFPYSQKASDVLDSLMDAARGVKYFTATEVQSVNRLKKSFNVKLSNGITIMADALVVATGFDLFDAHRKEEYGYGIYDRVVTNADLEAWFRTGSDKRISNPERVGFVHCVGSRDEKVGCRNCSKVCCATAVKQAMEISEAFPSAQVYCFYMDLRMFGRHYEDMYLRAQREYGVRFIRGRVSEVAENADGTLQVKAEDTLSSTPLKVTLDLLVLMAGMSPAKGNSALASQLLLGIDDDGFVNPIEGVGTQTETSVEGLFVCGAATGPKTLPDCFAEGKAAALSVHNYLSSLK